VRLCKIERILIFDRIQIGAIYVRKGNGFDCFSNFSTSILKLKLNLISLMRSNILKTKLKRLQQVVWSVLEVEL